MVDPDDYLSDLVCNFRDRFPGNGPPIAPVEVQGRGAPFCMSCNSRQGRVDRRTRVPGAQGWQIWGSKFEFRGGV